MKPILPSRANHCALRRFFDDAICGALLFGARLSYGQVVRPIRPGVSPGPDPGFRLEETRLNQLDMKGRTAVITGGAAGIGFAIAQRLVQSGAQVCLWDRDDKALADSAKALGAAAHGVKLDVSQEASVAAALVETLKRFP